MYVISFFFFFFNDTATTEIYTLSLHDALPIFTPCPAPFRSPRRLCRGGRRRPSPGHHHRRWCRGVPRWRRRSRDRKSTRLNSSHANISYAVFCLKKKKPKISQYYIVDALSVKT